MPLKTSWTTLWHFQLPWRAGTGHSKLSHFGKISILLGGGNFHAFPKEQDRNSTGTALFKSEITTKYLIFGRPNSIFKWKEPARNITLNKFITFAPSTSENPANPTAPPPNSTGCQESAPMIQPGQRKKNLQTPRSRLYAKPLFLRVPWHPLRRDTPRDVYEASYLKIKPNTNRFQVPGVNPTSRLHGQKNAAPGYKDWKQQPARVTELITKEIGAGRRDKNIAPGPKKDGVSRILAPDTGTYYGDFMTNLQIKILHSWQIHSSRFKLYFCSFLFNLTIVFSSLFKILKFKFSLFNFIPQLFTSRPVNLEHNQ